jgi:rare lipoprotein A
MKKLFATSLLTLSALALMPTVAEASCGQASWYGPGFHGRRTASGETFNQNDLTAAHPSLPFGTRVRVTRNGRSVVVRINDRGPYTGGRIIDLSAAAASQIGLRSLGVGNVCLTRL